MLTNRFLTKFVFRRIEEPLDILTAGVHEIRDGNLNFRIQYDRQDEFLPICEDFNEMAVRLKESVTKIQQQEQNRKELLAGISHDIRSPLTSIQAYVEGLMDGVARTPKVQRSYLATIKTKVEDLDRMVSQLFLFSKMELGDYPENSIRLRLDEKIEAAVLEAKEEYKEHGLQLITDLTPVTVTADPIQLERVISNVMGNSLKYKEQEKGLLRISLIKNGATCTLTFDDDGPGVPEEALPHLFEAFYRSDPARQNPQKGSGLGLAIVKSIITHAGGSIQAKRSEFGGLKIEICLSCEEGSESDGKNTDRGR
ncbi:HAMP domain-containing sensor histidine kinase [Solibaculum mannosilyticum]|uniref:sensor histidine kinase n=1 Tax=Solibaculum mannosilyticum TaxID=2780922 RepID=UPI0031B58A4F